MTARQQAIYEWICAYFDTHGYPPTVREIGAAFDIKSLNGVVVNLRALEKHGALKIDRGRARGIVLLAEVSGCPSCTLLRAELDLLRAEFEFYKAEAADALSRMDHECTERNPRHASK